MSDITPDLGRAHSAESNVEGFDIAYLNSHAAASWAYLLATEDELRGALVRLDEFAREHTAKHREIVEDALAKRFALPGEQARG